MGKKKYIFDKRKINIFERIQLNWKFEWKFYHKDIYNFFKNLKHYWSFIKNDRDWDFRYTEDMLLLKYKKQLKYFNNYNKDYRHERHHKDEQVLRILINILERRKSSWYTNVWHSKYAYKEKHYFENIEGTEYNEWKTEGLDKKEQHLSHLWLLRMNKCEERDWNIFCDIIKKYHDKIWI